MKSFSNSISIYSAIINPLQNNKSITMKLMITDQLVNNNHKLSAYIGSVESFDKNINASTETNKIINGRTTLYNLNNGRAIVSVIRGGIDMGITTTGSNIKLNSVSPDEASSGGGSTPFSKCFSDCVFSFVQNMSWLERALCLIDIEECLPGTTIGCTI